MNSSKGTSVAKVREAVEKVLAQEYYKKKADRDGRGDRAIARN